MSYLYQDIGNITENPSISDNRVLDEFEIPFGAWMDQAVDWITVNLGWLLDLVRWPFDTLISFLVQDILEPISWVWIVLAFFLIGALVRNIKVGAFAAVGLGVCGLLGNALWLETVRTIGYVGVAVLLCVLIGIPLGIACGRIDTLWQVVRPALDAMQVVHSFVYMLPFIYFFGVGEVSATMVTMVFALPPLVRLTNLGIRQVPEDVVEASRAYGAPEWRVLIDVQVPLARPAIMTGINQTLLLAISMLGIAAIMGAGGLGRPLLGALNRQSVAEGAASGLAFFLVAVVLDRVSQPENTDQGSLFRRIRLAWSHRRDPEKLLDSGVASTKIEDSAVETESQAVSTVAPAGTVERRPILLTAAAGLLISLSVFFVWSKGAGFMSAYGRRIDEDLAGQSYNGLSASGGSWFGYLTLILGLLVVAAAVSALIAPGRGPRWWSADGAVIYSLSVLVMMVSYALASPSDRAVEYSHGIGVFIALLGALVAAVGSLWWIRLAPYSSIRPLSTRIGRGRLFGTAVVLIVVGIGAISGWSFDGRADVVLDTEALAQIDALEAEAVANPANSGVIAMEIATLSEQLKAEKLIVVDGIASQGTRLGIWTFLASLAALFVSLPAAGFFGSGERERWLWSAITAGIGAGIACVAFGWIFTNVRSADDNYLSGVGSFLALMGGCVLVAFAGGVLKEFRRSKVYSGGVIQKVEPEEVESAGAVAEPAGTVTIG